MCTLQHIYLEKEKLVKPHANRGTTFFELLPAGELEAKRLMSQVGCAHTVSLKPDPIMTSAERKMTQWHNKICAPFQASSLPQLLEAFSLAVLQHAALLQGLW